MTELQIKIAAWLASVAVVFSLFYGAYRYGRHVESLEQDKARNEAVIKQQESDREDLLAYAEALAKGQTEHDQNLAVIANLRHQLDGVRVHFPTCQGAADPAQATNQNGEAGVLSTGVDELFAELQSRVGQIVGRCDQLNADAIRSNTQ